MEIISLPLEKDQWLTDALKVSGYNNIPTNVIFKKTLPGLGATYGEIKAKRHSIIIEPNVPVIVGKTKGKAELLGIYGSDADKKKKNIEKYLNDDKVKYKKILTTPESYHLIKEVIQSKKIKFDLYKDFFCLFDECEKLIQDIDYREEITQPITDFFLFQNKAFVSATTLDMTHPEFEKQGFKILEVKPNFDYKKDIELIITNTFEVDLLKKLEQLKESEHICIFLNKTDSIDKIVNSLGIKKQSKIFCSDKSAKKLGKKDYTDVFDYINFPLKKYNFFTCRFFSAVDIEFKGRPDILILTILKDAEHTMIDPFTESIQIYGRFRKNKYHGEHLPFNSLTHLTDFNPNFKVKTKEQINQTIATYKNTYIKRKQEIDESSDETEKDALRDDFKTLKYHSFLDSKGEYNYFSQDNFYHGERVKGYYSKPDLLEQAYRDTEHFNIVNLVKNDSVFTFDTQWFKESRKPTKDIRKNIIDALEEIVNQKNKDSDFDINKHKDVLRRVEVSTTETGALMVDAFDYLGLKEVQSIGYTSPAKIKKAVNKAKAIQKEIDCFNIIITELQGKYKIDDTPTKNEVKEFLSELYKFNGIDRNVKQDTIRNYCDVTEHNNKKPAEFRIKGFLSEFGAKFV